MVTRWPGSQKVWGFIPGCATKFVRCKNLAFTLAQIPRKAIGPMYIGRVIPKHVKDPRAPIDKSTVLIPGVTAWSDTRITNNSCKAKQTPLSLNVHRCVIDFGLG